MDYRIEKSEAGKYLRVIVEGGVSVEKVREFAADVREMSLETGIGRFLFDVRNARNVASAFENYMFAYRDSNELNLDRSARVVILARPDDRSHDFAVVTLKNAGHFVRLYSDESSAIEWLEVDR